MSTQPDRPKLRLFVTLNKGTEMFDLWIGVAPPVCRDNPLRWRLAVGLHWFAYRTREDVIGLFPAHADNLPAPGKGYLAIPLGEPELVKP